MKRIFLIRHAKSDHGPQYKNDFVRPLNKRGKRDAPMMAEQMKNMIAEPDCFVVSSAQRAKETADYFITAYDMKPDQIQYTDKLYLPPVTAIWEAIRETKPDCDSIAIFSHNPSLEDLLDEFRAGIRVPTCSITELHYSGGNWDTLERVDVKFHNHIYPKMYV